MNNFNWKKYLDNYPDLQLAGIVTERDAWKHYQRFGKLEKRTDQNIITVINKNGFWEGVQASDHHYYDEKLSKSILSFLKKENVNSIVDFGCGMGRYVRHFKENGISANGFDGNPATFVLSNGFCDTLDLSVPKQFNTPFDWVMSLEVGEHLPKEFEDIFINNLHNNNQFGIILSWAVEGQGGYGHFNEQNNDYLKSKICKLGYTNDIDVENTLREQSSAGWFKNTIMVFRKNNN